MTLKPGKNIRLFKNPILEQLTYVHPVMPALMWVPIILFCFGRGMHIYHLPLTQSLLLVLYGFFIWTFSEYALHRFIFHFHAKGAFQERILFLIHGIHHDDPNDQRRLLMPPAAAAIIASIFWVLFTAILGRASVNPFFSGFLIGYLCYDYIHFATHFGRYKNGVFKFLKDYHMQHHFRQEDRMYGVSNPFWDYVFRTQPK